MKLMIVSDIHGSAYWCKAMLSAFKREAAQRLVLLGDILYHGPRNNLPQDYAPKEVISMLNLLKGRILCVRGNCDTEVDQMVLDFPIMGDYGVVLADKRVFYISHGHIYNRQNMPPLSEGDILIMGHTHIPAREVWGDNIYINPGSVSIPKNGSPHSYITYEDGLFLWKDMEGEVYDKLKL